MYCVCMYGWDGLSVTCRRSHVGWVLHLPACWVEQAPNGQGRAGVAVWRVYSASALLDTCGTTNACWINRRLRSVLWWE